MHKTNSCVQIKIHFLCIIRIISDAFPTTAENSEMPACKSEYIKEHPESGAFAV